MRVLSELISSRVAADRRFHVGSLRLESRQPLVELGVLLGRERVTCAEVVEATAKRGDPAGTWRIFVGCLGAPPGDDRIEELLELSDFAFVIVAVAVVVTTRLGRSLRVVGSARPRPAACLSVASPSAPIEASSTSTCSRSWSLCSRASIARISASRRAVSDERRRSRASTAIRSALISRARSSAPARTSSSSAAASLRSSSTRAARASVSSARLAPRSASRSADAPASVSRSRTLASSRASEISARRRASSWAAAALHAPGLASEARRVWTKPGHRLTTLVLARALGAPSIKRLSSSTTCSSSRTSRSLIPVASDWSRSTCDSSHACSRTSCSARRCATRSASAARRCSVRAASVARTASRRASAALEPALAWR